MKVVLNASTKMVLFKLWIVSSIPGGGGTLRISGCGCAARTLEPLAYTRASFSWILLPYTRVNSRFPWSSQPTGQFREK